MVESWMIHGTNHWFIKPSVCNKINADSQNKILEAILDKSRNIGHEFELTVFNDLKQQIFDTIRKNYNKLSKPIIDLLQKEEAKQSLT